jgi:DNA end-binding protein Ku
VAAPRPYWKGYLRLSLVSIGVELYPALASAERLELHQIHRPSGKRIRYQKTVPGLGAVEASDITRGVEVEDDTYVIVEPAELQQIKLESRHAIDLVQFVDQSEVDPRYFDRPYYVVPASEVSEEGFQVLRVALRSEKKLGLGQLALRGHEYLVAVRPCGKGMLLETLHYADEVRGSDALFEHLPGDKDIDRQKVELARRLIAEKTSAFDAAAFRDRYSAALRELVEGKRGRRTIHVPEEEGRRRKPAEVIDLMEALKKSVAGDKARQAARRPRAGGRPTVAKKRRRPG